MIIKSENFTLRSWRREDMPLLVGLANNRKIYDNLRDLFPYPYTMRDAAKWLEYVELNDTPPRFFAIEFDGELAGSIAAEFKADIYRKNVEIGYWLGEIYWNRGIMTEAIRLITDYIFANFDTLRVYAEPFADNAGSRKALEKVGFTCEVVFREYVIKNNEIKDSCIYSVLRKEWMRHFH